MSDTVTGGPLRWLRLDGLVLLAGCVALFGRTDQAWWLFPVLLLAPDVAMLGYLANPRVGALAYNLGHSYLLPAGLAVAGVLTDRPVATALGLIWLAHLGMDRALGYGLKYGDDFQHTHLGRLGRPPAG